MSSSSRSINSTTLTDLPPELLDHILASLPTAQSVARLGRVNRRLHTFIEQDGWQTFLRNRFPSLWPPGDSPTHRDVARTLTTVSRAWDRRAFIARGIYPKGYIYAFPEGRLLDHWVRPRGQSIGFAPQIDCYEEIEGSWSDRREVLIISAGAEICVRRLWKSVATPRKTTTWSTYRPPGLPEGHSDITGLHLLRPQSASSNEHAESIITGRADGSLELLSLANDNTGFRIQTQFETDSLSVRSTSVLQQQHEESEALLAAALGDTRISLYRINGEEHKRTAPLSSIEVRQSGNARRTFRTWSTNFISPTTLAVGTGPSEKSIQIYGITPSGLSETSTRNFALENSQDTTQVQGNDSEQVERYASSVYPIIPLSSTINSSLSGNQDNKLFLSGAYDGIIRLHDLRSPTSVCQKYIDEIDDSAIYSLLARGQESFVAGSARHSLLKVFDLRLGAKAYSYLDASKANSEEIDPSGCDWSLFVKPHSATYPGRGGGNNWARRSAESSIYSLASPAPYSPYIYAGIENAVVELLFTEVLDRHSDPTFFRWSLFNKKVPEIDRAIRGMAHEVVDLAMHDNTDDFKLCTQRSLWETWCLDSKSNKRKEGSETLIPGLDARWKVVT